MPGDGYFAASQTRLPRKHLLQKPENNDFRQDGPTATATACDPAGKQGLPREQGLDRSHPAPQEAPGLRRRPGPNHTRELRRGGPAGTSGAMTFGHKRHQRHVNKGGRWHQRRLWQLPSPGHSASWDRGHSIPLQLNPLPSRPFHHFPTVKCLSSRYRIPHKALAEASSG